MDDSREIIEALAEKGWGVKDPLLDPQLLAALAETARRRWEGKEFHSAGTGRGSSHAVRSDVRGDYVRWLDTQAPETAAEAHYVEAMEKLRQELNRELFLSLIDFEAHFAAFPPGTFYRKHLDRFSDNDQRMLSTVLYLNPAWNASDGGQLRLYHSDTEYTEIVPRLGTFVLFRSDTVPHEVLPATTPRFSIAAWFRRRSLLPF